MKHFEHEKPLVKGLDYPSNIIPKNIQKLNRATNRDNFMKEKYNHWRIHKHLSWDEPSQPYSYPKHPATIYTSPPMPLSWDEPSDPYSYPKHPATIPANPPMPPMSNVKRCEQICQQCTNSTKKAGQKSHDCNLTHNRNEPLAPENCPFMLEHVVQQDHEDNQ